MTAERPASPRRAATRARLLDAARDVFAERGAGGASVESVCQRAGFTRGAFYSNYASMDDLTTELMRLVGEGRLRAVQAAAAGVKPSSELQPSLHEALSAFVRLQEQTAESVLLITELELYAVRHPEVRAAHTLVLHETLLSIVDLVVPLLERFDWRLRLPPTLMMEVLHAFFDHAALISHVTGQGADSEALVDKLVTLFTALSEPKPGSTVDGDR